MGSGSKRKTKNRLWGEPGSASFTAPFRTTHLSETGFSPLVTTRIKLRSQMHSDHDLSSLSNTCPLYEGISKLVWHQGSQHSTNNFFLHSMLFQYSCFCPSRPALGLTQPRLQMGTGSFPGVKCGRGVPLTTHPLLVPRSWKSRAIPLPTL